MGREQDASSCRVLLGDAPSFANMIVVSNVRWTKRILALESAEWKELNFADGRWRGKLVGGFEKEGLPYPLTERAWLFLCQSDI